MGAEERICGICLKICDEFKVIGEDMKGVFGLVLPKINLITAIREPLMCTNCTEMITECFDFKTACLHTHGYIVPFVDNKDSVKLDLKEVYVRKNQNCTGLSEDQGVCGLCMCPVKNCFSIDLDVGQGELKFTKMIKQCLPELDLSIIKKPVICPPCHGSLEHCFRFVSTCFLAEDKIKKYCDSLKINSNVQIELSNLLQFTIKDVIKSEADDSPVDISKAEEQLYEEIENANGGDVEMEEKFLVEEKIEVKTDDSDFSSSQEAPTSSQSITKSINLCTKEHVATDQVLLRGRTKNLKNMAEIKPANRNSSGVTEYKCQNCPFITKNKASLKTHMLTHREISKVRVFMCEICFFVAMQKTDLESHMLKTHGQILKATVYKCQCCSYTTNRKVNLKSHMLTHRELSVVMVYTCDNCPYTTKNKWHLKQHMVTHQELSEVTAYSCERCSFVSKYKAALKTHMLIHRELSEVTVYTCDSCGYVTKRKGDLKSHMLSHRELSEVTVYSCESCTFVTKHKGYLKQHILTHRELSEVIVYTCESCKFVTKYEASLKRHMLTHR